MSIILMRHAESHYNETKRNLKTKHLQNGLKKTKEYLSLRTNPKLKDPTVTHNGSLEVRGARSTIDWDCVQVIFVSPLRRCLETCRILLEESGRNIEVKVLPMLQSRLTGSSDHGSSLRDLKLSYSQYNFDSVPEEESTPWYIKNLDSNKQALFEKLRHSEETLFNGLEQNYFEFRNRVEKLKKVLDHEMASLKEGSKILMITHNCVLRTLTASLFDHRGKGQSQHKFQNAKPITICQSKLFSWLKMDQQTEVQTVCSNETN